MDQEELFDEADSEFSRYNKLFLPVLFKTSVNIYSVDFYGWIRSVNFLDIKF